MTRAPTATGRGEQDQGGPIPQGTTHPQLVEALQRAQDQACETCLGAIMAELIAQVVN